MINRQVDRNPSYMHDMWGTTKLVTDYQSTPKTLKEVMYDEQSVKDHHLKDQAELHEKIRNDEDYDDWEYGTEPVYGKPQ
jgi:lipoate synthase